MKPDKLLFAAAITTIAAACLSVILPALNDICAAYVCEEDVGG